MAKKAAPVKAKAKPSAKGATKKAAPLKALKKVAAKSDSKSAKAKPSLKSDAKKDVKTSAMKKAEVKAPAAKVTKATAAIAAKGAKGASAPAALKGKATAGKTPVTLNVKAATAPVVEKPLTKPLTKAAKGKGKARASAPKNYEDMCREIACESGQTTSGYCRLHYIKNWKKIKRKELILREKKLNQYIEELVSKYPDKYIEAIKSDLSDEKAFSKVIYDLELDESVDDIPGDDEADESIIENIKGAFDDTDSDF